MKNQMMSVADTRPDADDDLTEISPELVLVDPELARRLREREPAPVIDDQSAAPLLRLVIAEEPPRPADPVPVDEPVPASAVEPVAEPAPVSAGAEVLVPEAQLEPESEPEAEVEPEAELEPEPEFEPEPDAPEGSASLPRVVIDVEDLIVPRTVEVDDQRVGPTPTVVSPTAPAITLPPVDEPEPSAPALAPEPAPEAPAAATTTAAPLPPRRRGVILRVVLGAAIATALVAGILDRTGASPLPAGAPPSWPVADDNTPQAVAPERSAPTPDTEKPKAAKKPKAAAKSKPNGAQAEAKTKARARTNPRPAAAAPEPRRFAWAPAAGAVGYHVELFRGPNRVLARDTKKPVLELGPTWRHEGRVMRLTEGSYRWYVWSVTSSGRNPQAIVQATLSVP